MKTRTLLLLALACGIAIMLAGAVFLFQLATRDAVAEPIAVGSPVEVGDMTVLVEGSSERAGELTVRIRIGGVDDLDGTAGFHLIASGRPVSRSTDDAADACGATTVTDQECVLRFDTSTADGTSRVLFYERGDDGVRWTLNSTG